MVRLKFQTTLNEFSSTVANRIETTRGRAKCTYAVYNQEMHRGHDDERPILCFNKFTRLAGSSLFHLSYPRELERTGKPSCSIVKEAATLPQIEPEKEWVSI